MIYYQIWLGNQIPVEYQDCMFATRCTIEAAGHECELIHIPEFIGSAHECAILKDRIQLAMSCRVDCAFVDCDLIVKSLYSPPEGLPAMIYEWGAPRVGYYMVNGCMGFFSDLMADKEQRGIKNVYGYPNKLLRNTKPIEIPRSTYEHLRIISGKREYY